MSLFLYPKTKHVRTQRPRVFKNYRSYKRYLQTEFARICVYCRQPDSSAPNLNFGADHYRPKSVPRFAPMLCDYNNLYYCCGTCNSRKNDYWPFDEKAGPFVVNPCEHEMASHLRFNSSTGEIETRSPHGEHTEELLQLNDPELIQYRRSALTIVRLLKAEIVEAKEEFAVVENAYVAGKITLTQRDSVIAEIQAELDLLMHTLHAQTGELALRPLKKQKLGISIIVP